MRYLLDTHSLYWWIYFPELLPRKAHAILSDPDAKCFVSAVSAYEMAFKHYRGRWSEIAGLVAAFEEIVAAEEFEVLPLMARHAICAGAYPMQHRDPFDRLLAAQAEVERLTLVSKDRKMREMGAEVVWR